MCPSVQGRYKSFAVAALGIFVWGCCPWSGGGKSPVILSRRSGDQVPQKLKQFADIVYRF